MKRFAHRFTVVFAAFVALYLMACEESETDNPENESQQGSSDEANNSDSGIAAPGEDGFVNTAKIETCLNRETGFCEVTLVSAAGMDSSEFTCSFESGEAVESCPVDGCLGKCTTDFGALVLIRYAYSETENDVEAACSLLEGEWTTDCSE